MGDAFYFQNRRRRREEEERDEAASDDDEALSLSDLPLDNNDDRDNAMTSDESVPFNGFFEPGGPRRSSSQPSDFFEFFGVVDSLTSDRVMCSADDIIICGKLVPFKEPCHHSSNPSSTNPFVGGDRREELASGRKPQATGTKAALAFRSRSESSTIDLRTTKTKLTRNSRSLDYRKLQRDSSPDTSATNSSSTRCFGKPADVTAKRAARPRWSLFMFGMAKFPAEMELEDIKTRQLRRSPTTLFVPTEPAAGATRGSLPVTQRKGSWKLLKALSCKDHTSVAVTTPFAVFPKAELLPKIY